MLLNEQIKKEMKKCETADECRMFMQKALTHYKYKTLYNMCYSDYGQTEFYEQIKAYQGSDDDFIVLITELKDSKVVKIKVAFMNTKPAKPHPLFPILNTVLGRNKIYEYTN